MQPSLSSEPSLPGLCPVTDAVEALATVGGIEERGAIFTRPEVVDFILDLVGYTADAPLLQYRILEPSFGNGDFLLPIIARLLTAAAAERDGFSQRRLGLALRAVELHRASYERTREAVLSMLQEHGLSPEDAVAIAEQWLVQGDFLLAPIDGGFTHVVGNPPYVRQESIPDVLMREYRLRYATIYDRADIYVPFIERSLNLLEPEGRLGFICADRWMKNRYGAKLRDKIRHGYALDVYVDMVDTDPFRGEVSAYPAITVMRRGEDRGTRVFARPAIERQALRNLAGDLLAAQLRPASGVAALQQAISHDGPWVFDAAEELALARRLQAAFPTLEDAGCKVGIGVATGADQAFIGDFATLDVEDSRKLPLAMTKDLVDGDIRWCGRGVINPFDDTGKLVDLAAFPRLSAYLDAHRDVIAKRHVATKMPANWYRTIDRIYPELTWREKLLVPDIRGDAAFVFEPGKLYPHHNLYYIVSDAWDLRALQTVMQAGIAKLFVSLFSTKMRGGYLRFQAQYLRRIHVPRWEDVPGDLRQRLIAASDTVNDDERVTLVAELYGLNSTDRQVLQNLNGTYA